MKIAWEIPTGRGDTSSLFTNVAEELHFVCTTHFFNYCLIRHLVAIEIIANKLTLTLGLFFNSRKKVLCSGIVYY